MNLPLARYKERLVDRSLTDVDFNYSFEATEQYSLIKQIGSVKSYAQI